MSESNNDEKTADYGEVKRMAMKDLEPKMVEINNEGPGARCLVSVELRYLAYIIEQGVETVSGGLAIYHRGDGTIQIKSDLILKSPWQPEKKAPLSEHDGIG